MTRSIPQQRVLTALALVHDWTRSRKTLAPEHNPNYV